MIPRESITRCHIVQSIRFRVFFLEQIYLYERTGLWESIASSELHAAVRLLATIYTIPPQDLRAMLDIFVL